jgi:gamma-glutamyltranspeptidase/glutathione hydrolase
MKTLYCRRRLALGAMLCALAALCPAVAGAVEGSRFQPAVRSPLGVVVSPTPQASEVGRQVLRSGGNAVDAAVAATLAVGVTDPGECGLGGTARLLYRGADGQAVVFDGGAKTPAAATPTTIGSTPGGIDSTMGLGHRMVGVPGALAGLADALNTFGTIPLSVAITPAESLARDGFVVGRDLAGQLAAVAPALRLFPQTAAVYLIDGQNPYPAGSTLVQPDLARTLNLIAEQGAGAFYSGPIADEITAEMTKPAAYPGDEAIMTSSDLANYAPVRREPLVSNYRGYGIVTVPPPMFGADVIETLNILKGFDLRAFGPSSADALHVLGEAQKLAETDSFIVVTDPAFYDVPLGTITSPTFAAARRDQISMDEARAPQPGIFDAHPHTFHSSHALKGDTTNVAVIDRWGNAVDVTCTLSGLFGSAVVADGTGVLLNNSMRNGDPPGFPNQIEGNKFLGTAQAPTIVEHNGLPVLVVGAAGNAAIFRDVVEIISNVVDFGMDMAHAVDAERFHAYGFTVDGFTQPPIALVEDARIAPSVLDELARRGHFLIPLGEYGDISVGIVNAAGIDPRTGDRLGTADPRSLDGTALGQ